MEIIQNFMIKSEEIKRLKISEDLNEFLNGTSSVATSFEIEEIFSNVSVFNKSLKRGTNYFLVEKRKDPEALRFILKDKDIPPTVARALLYSDEVYFEKLLTSKSEKGARVRKAFFDYIKNVPII